MAPFRYLLVSLYALLFLLQGCAPQYQVEMETPVPEPQSDVLSDAYFKEQPGEIFIVIDPGHGGEDFGAHSTTRPKYHEKNLNLVLGRLLQQNLDFHGYKTAMTRQGDVFIALDKRAAYANNMNADLYVSVHFNSAPSVEAAGIEVYFYRSSNDPERTKKSSELAQAVLDNTVKMTHAKSRGIKHGDFAVIRKTNMPAILVEAGFLTNEKEMESIKDPAYLKKIAWGISLGINQYLNK